MWRLHCPDGESIFIRPGGNLSGEWMGVKTMTTSLLLLFSFLTFAIGYGLGVLVNRYEDNRQLDFIEDWLDQEFSSNDEMHHPKKGK